MGGWVVGWPSGRSSRATVKLSSQAGSLLTEHAWMQNLAEGGFTSLGSMARGTFVHYRHK